MPEMNDEHLRMLFRDAGPAKAPASLGPAVMERLRTMGSPTATAPLLNGRQWALALCTLIGVVALASLLGPSNGNWTGWRLPLALGSKVAGTLTGHPWIPAASCLAFLWMLWDRRAALHHAA